MRRVAPVVVLTVALAASANATSATPKTVDRTVSCATELGALQFDAMATNPSAGGASASIGTGNPNNGAGLLWFATGHSHTTNYSVGNTCRTVKTRVAFTHRGLASSGVSLAGQYRSPGAAFCSAPRHVLLRFRAGFDGSGNPITATIAIWTQPAAHRAARPIGFVQWSPSRSVTYYSPACTSQ